MHWRRDLNNAYHAQTLLFKSAQDENGIEVVWLGLFPYDTQKDELKAVAWSPLPEEAMQVGWAYVQYGKSFLVPFNDPHPYFATPVYLGATPVGGAQPFRYLFGETSSE